MVHFHDVGTLSWLRVVPGVNAEVTKPRPRFVLGNAGKEASLQDGLR